MALLSARSHVVGVRAPSQKSVAPSMARRSCRSVAVSAKKEQGPAATLLALPTAAATLLAAGNAQAATELATLAASDNRFGTISLLFLPALGWVAFNMLSPLNNQLARMAEMNAGGASSGKKRRGVAGAVGLGAALALASAQAADAATEVAQLAAGDNRFGTISLLFLPALGWVAFNMLSPLNNQLARMAEMNAGGASSGKKRR